MPAHIQRLPATAPTTCPLRVIIAPQEWPYLNLVTLAWDTHQLVAAVHPGIRGYDIARDLVESEHAPDWVLEQWLSAFGVYAPAVCIRTQWRALIAPIADLIAYPENLPPALRG